MPSNSNWIPPGFDRNMVGKDYPGISREGRAGSGRANHGTRYGVPQAPERPRPGTAPSGAGIARDEAELPDDK